MTESISQQVRELVRSDAGLAKWIAFVRAYDPTDALFRRWGADCAARRDGLLARADEAVSSGERFAASETELLFCLVHAVTAAPYLGTPEAQILQHLRSLAGAVQPTTGHGDGEA